MRLISPILCFTIAAFAFGGPAATTKAPPLPSLPGSYRNLPCPEHPELTFDLHLPPNTSPAPNGRMALIISGPNGKPGFRDLETWADARGVVLVTVNDSKNGPYDRIMIAQEAVLAGIAPLKLHPTLKFATGFSGGGAASLAMASRHPDAFSGVVLQCHSGFSLEKIKKHPPAIGVAFLGAVEDNTHPCGFLLGFSQLLRRTNTYVYEDYGSGGHNWRPTATVCAALDNLILHALRRPGVRGGPDRNSPPEWQRVLTKKADDGDLDRCAAILDSPILKKHPLHDGILTAWLDSRIAAWSELPPKKAADACCEAENNRILETLTGADARKRDLFLKKLESDPDAAKRLAAFRAFQSVWAGYAKVLDSPDGKLDFAKLDAEKAKLKLHAQKHPGYPESHIAKRAP